MKRLKFRIRLEPIEIKTRNLCISLSEIGLNTNVEQKQIVLKVDYS